jgi:hypothetical protein
VLNCCVVLSARKPVWPALIIALLLGLFAANLYRARTQSITIDEAFTYNAFVDGPPGLIFKSYDANHHVLHTILCRISIGLFGNSEFALRIPSLLGGLFYMVTVLRLCRYAFGGGWFSFLSFALLSMSPAVLDYMSAARGYGLALAFFVWALFQVVRYCEDRSDTRIGKAAVGLALSVACNLSLAIPGAALGIVFLFLLIGEGKGRDAADRFVVPGIVLAFVIVILPLTHMEGNPFYLGSTDLGESLESVVTVGWAHHDGQPLSLTRYLEHLLRGARIVIPAILAVAAAMAVRTVFRRMWTRTGALLVFATGSLIGSVLLLILGHRMFHLLYPLRRTGLYWIPLFLLVSLLLINDALNSNRLTAAPAVLAAVVCLAEFASQLCVRHYAEWPGDVSSKRLVQEIQKQHALRPKAPVRIGIVSWQLEPGLNFYRRIYQLGWMQPIERDPPSAPCDYYLALPPETELLDKMGLTKIYEDDRTRAVLATPAL